MPRRSNCHKSQKKASNQKSNDQLGGSRNYDRRCSNRKSSDRSHSDNSHSDNSHSDRGGEDCEPRRPVDASREASLDRTAQSSGSDTLDGESPMPSKPPSPLPNHDNMNSGPCYCLKITVYETTHKGYGQPGTSNIL